MTLKKKKLISALLITTVLLVGVFGSLNSIQAQNLRTLSTPGESVPLGDNSTNNTNTNSSDSTENSIVNVLAWIVFYIATFFSWLVSIMIGVMVYVASYNQFLDTAIVKNGWSIVRDVANNFFIVVLLVIAVGTILRVPNYNRQLLPKLLVMAVLINFSKVFAGIMIDFSQVITLWLAGAIKGVSDNGNIILLALGLDKLYRVNTSGLSITDPLPGGGLDGAEVLKTLFFALILSVVAVVVMAMITIVLVYRIVMLWFLVILSPLAFLLTTFPKGQQYAGMWWSEMAKYLVVGPVMLFFLYLSFFSGSINITDPSNGAGSANTINIETGALELGKDVTAVGLTEVQNSPVKLFDFLIIIGLMVGSLVFGQKTGAAGGQWAGKGVSNLQKWGKKATLGTAGLVGRTAQGTIAAVPGGRSIPLIGTRVGKAVDQRKVQLATTKAKAEQEKITARSGALELGGKSEGELRKLALGGDKYAKIAATQALMKQGMFRDDDDANRGDNIRMINNAKKMLPPELAATFMENTKKYNPGLAHDTVYRDSDNNFRTDAFVSDVKTGKVKAHEMMEALNTSQVEELDKALIAGKHGKIGEFLLNNISEKDLGEMNGNVLDDVREKIWSGVDHKTWDRNNDNGEITDSGKKMRDKFIKSGGFNNLDKAFDDSELEDKRTFVANNRSDISKKIKNVSDKLIEDVGDIIKVDDFKDRGPVFNKMLTDKFQTAIDSVDFAKLKDIDADETLKKRFQDRLKNGLMAGATIKDEQLNKTNPENNARRRIAEDIYKYSNSKDVEKMKGLNPKTNKTLFDIASRNLSTGVVKNLTASPDGSIMGAAMVDKIREDARLGDAPQQERADKLKDI